jgi:Tfp pilus assembly protein PilN
VALTLFNLTSVFILGKDYRAQRSELKHKKERLEFLKKDVAEKQKILDSTGVATFAGEAQFVSEVLALKRFSWIRFLEDLERVKPFGVQLETVSPSIGKGKSVGVTLNGRANQRSELLKFEQNLMNDSSFYGFLLQNETREKNSPFVGFGLTTKYIPEANREPR